MKIVYATDGSEGAFAPARFFAQLPPRKDIFVHLLTVLEKNDTRDGTETLSRAKAALGDFSRNVTLEVAHVRSHATSDVAPRLLDGADAVGADLIAIGASGHSAIEKFFLGSVAESVARYARHPVVVVRPKVDTLQDVVVGVDGSECSRGAAEFVVDRFPLPVDCTVHLASVIPQPALGFIADPLYPGAPDIVALEMANRQARSRACQETNALAEELRKPEGGPRIVVEAIALGNPPTELVRMGNEHHAGLIVVGSHGLAGMKRFLLGSVSERVMRHAHGSVLIVK